MTRAEALDTTFMITTTAAPYRVTLAGSPEAYLSYGEVATAVDTVNVASVIATGTKTPISPLAHDASTSPVRPSTFSRVASLERLSYAKIQQPAEYWQAMR